MLSSWAAQSAGKVPTTWFLGGVNTQFSPSRKSLPASAAVRRSSTRRSGDVQPRSVLSEAQTDACSRLAYGRRGASPSGVHEGANLVHTSRNTALQAAKASERRPFATRRRLDVGVVLTRLRETHDTSPVHSRNSRSNGRCEPTCRCVSPPPTLTPIPTQTHVHGGEDTHTRAKAAHIHGQAFHT